MVGHENSVKEKPKSLAESQSSSCGRRSLAILEVNRAWEACGPLPLFSFDNFVKVDLRAAAGPATISKPLFLKQQSQSQTLESESLSINRDTKCLELPASWYALGPTWPVFELKAHQADICNSRKSRNERSVQVWIFAHTKRFYGTTTCKTIL